MTVKKFKNVSTGDIIKISHEETAWLVHQQKKSEIAMITPSGWSICSP